MHRIWAQILTLSLVAGSAGAGEERGYRLLHDGLQVGQEAGWDIGQAIDNFRWNVQTHSSVRVCARFDGQALTYLQAVSVLPVFYVPTGAAEPTVDQGARLTRHLDLARARYRALLPQDITFSVAEEPARLVRSKQDLAWMRKDYQAEALGMTCEILAALEVTRLDCPWVLLVVVMNEKDGFPAGGGRPLAGGLNRGGGIVFLSSHDLDGHPAFQSTLQHELGHGFGLTHADVYGRDMKTGRSIMSYNLAHHYKGFTPPQEPGVLLPEDLRALAYNQLVFPGLRFDPKRDLPAGYDLPAQVIVLNPMPLACPARPAPPPDLPERCEPRQPAKYWEAGREILHGPVWTCYPSGAFKTAGTFKDGHQHGLWRYWTESGQLGTEDRYLASKREGLSRTWHKNGVLESETGYRADRWHGRMRKWNTSGRLTQDTGYENGKQHGEERAYDWLGNKVMQSHYRDGVLEGRQTSWFANGQKRSEGMVRAGKRDGTWRIWDEEGTLRTEFGLSADRNHGPFIDHFSSGGRFKLTTFQHGEFHGPFQRWYESGQLEQEGRYEGGKLEGLWREWHKDGSLALERHYHRGEACGQERRIDVRGEASLTDHPPCPDEAAE